MLTQHKIQVANAFLSKVNTSAKKFRCGPACIGWQSLLRQSTVAPSIPDVIQSQQVLTMHVRIPTKKWTYLINKDLMSFLLRNNNIEVVSAQSAIQKIQNPIPLPFIANFDNKNNHNRQADTIQPMGFTSSTDGLLFGLFPARSMENSSYNTTSAALASNDETIAQPHDDTGDTYHCMNRNSRRGKRANKGKRPCSGQHRRKRSRRFGNHNRS